MGKGTGGNGYFPELLQVLNRKVISREEVAEYRKTVREEEKEFQAQFMEKARELTVN